MKFSIFRFLGIAAIASSDNMVTLARNAASTPAMPSNAATVATATAKKATALAFLPADRNMNKYNKYNHHHNSLQSVVAKRGGACIDTSPKLLAKIGINVIAESIALYGILWASIQIAASEHYPSWIPAIFHQPLVELLASFVVVFGSSLVGTVIEGGMSAASGQALQPNTVPGDPEWYLGLNKPRWNPPGYVFPIMWLIVSKPTQLCALSRIFKFGLDGEGGRSSSSMKALAFYTTHLALGNAWNKVFFGLECIGTGTLVISLFFGALLASAYSFFQIDKLAGYYMLPTCGWVAIATALQYSIYALN